MAAGETVLRVLAGAAAAPPMETTTHSPVLATAAVASSNTFKGKSAVNAGNFQCSLPTLISSLLEKLLLLQQFFTTF